MKKINLLFIGLLALALAFTGCKNNDAPSNKTDDVTDVTTLDDSSWMIGNWKMVTTSETDVDVDGPGLDAQTKEMMKAMYAGMAIDPITENIEITADNVDDFSAQLKVYLANAEKGEQIVTQNGAAAKSKVTFTISSDKKTITYKTVVSTVSSNAGYKVTIDAIVTIVYTKQ